jgi:large subunit ribosomal protein L24
MLTIHKKDKVVVISGRSRGKQGEVVKVMLDEGRVLVSKINFVKRHSRGNPQQGEPGGIREKEASIAIANVMLVCPKCSKPMRPKADFLSDGTKVRTCRKCGEMLVS